MSDAKAPSMKPILFCVFAIMLSLGYLMFGELQKSNERIDIQFKMYQFATDLQFYLMDDESCTAMFKGQTFSENQPLEMKYVNGPVLKAGAVYQKLSFDELSMIQLEKLKGEFYTAKLNLKMSGKGKNNKSMTFPLKKMAFYFKAKDNKIQSCGVRNMILAAPSETSK